MFQEFITFEGWIGIIASVIVAISFVFKSQRKVRIVNTVGSIIFIVYGSLISSISIIFLNVTAIVINIIYLVKNKSI